MKFETSGPLRGELRLPGDKSICHRSVMLGALAQGTTRIRNFSGGGDNLSTLACLRGMGVQVDESHTGAEGASTLVVHGVGLHGLQEPGDVLDAGNSGTSMRILCGLLAAQSFFSVLSGDEHLRKRPMRRVIEPLREFGAEIYGREGDTLAPLAIRGRKLQGGSMTLKVASAQVKSALLLAGLYAEEGATIVEPGPSRDHTERLLAYMGADLAHAGNQVTLRPEPVLHGVEIDVAGDISSAAFFLVAALIVPGSQVVLKNVGVNPTRMGIVDILVHMGGDIRLENVRDVAGEPVADLVATHSALKGMEISGDLVVRAIDEFPVLAVAAAVAEGETRITGAEELRVKETDRIHAMTTELEKLGVDVEQYPDGMVIRGGRPVSGGQVSSYYDHRVAMSLAVAALVAEGPVYIENFECVAISFPRFREQLLSLMR